MSDWRCGTCSAMNAEAAVVCENCAGIIDAAHVVDWLATSPPLVGPAKWDQPCPEYGCDRTVGQHRDEIRRALELIAMRKLERRNAS